jgi:hypothetical protein
MSEPNSADEPGASGGRKRKVARVLETYGLEDLGPELEAAWTDDGGERASLRDLADRMNRAVIEAAMREVGEDPLSGEIETVYEALGAGEASAGVEQDVRGRLDRSGVDVETLESDLVSYQAIRTYLTRDREVEYSQPDTDPTASTRDRIQRLRGRLRAVTDQRLDDLAESGRLTLGETHTLVQVQVYCEDCGRQFEIDELLDRGGCECESEGEA